MTPIDRVVQLVNVRAPDSTTAQHVTTLVEDALRVASESGDIPGKLLVLRNLDLDAIPRAGSQTALVRTVEAAVERAVSNAVRADDPAAANAPMVYFADEADVVQSLAERVANNKPATEWFWPSVMKGWTPTTPTDRAITMLMERAVATAGGVVTLAHVVETLASTGLLDKLLERLSEADGRALLKAIGWTEAPPTRGLPNGVERPSAQLPVHELPAHEVPAHEPLVPEMPSHAQALVQRWITRWGGEVRDPRALWLGAMLLVADRPGRSNDAQLPEVVRVWLASLADPAVAEASAELRNEVARQAMRRDDLIMDARTWLQSHPRSPLDSLLGGGPPFPLAPREIGRGNSVEPGAVERRRPDEEPRGDSPDPDEAPTWKNPRPTDYAGLLFLIPLLSRTGVGDIVARDPSLIDRDWTTALLLRLARRLGVSRDDPSIAWLTAKSAVIAHADRALTAEVLRAVRIRIRMQAGHTMREIVQRRGAIVATHTHVDVLLHPSSIDADLQRAELHDDPGLVPWLARVVQFHYVDAVDINA